MSHNFSPVFIGGSGRSGTTVTLNMLQRHPQFHASLPREIKFLTSRHGLLNLIYQRPLSLEEDLHGLRNNLVTRVMPLLGRNQLHYFSQKLDGPWWSEDGKSGKPRGLIQSLSKDIVEQAHQRFMQSFKSDPTGASREFFYTLAQAQLKKPETKYFGDSTPVNMMHAYHIKELLPDARFINVIRDGRDVALSISKEHWGPNDPHAGLSWWANRVLKSAQALAKIESTFVHELRIEDLVVRTRDQSYENILDFLQLEDAPKLRQYFQEQMSTERLHIGRWRSEVKDPERFDATYRSLCEKLKSKGVEIKDLT